MMNFKLPNINNSLLFDSFVSLMVRVLGAVSGLLVSIIISRNIGIEGAGYYFLAFSVITFLSGLSRFGFDRIILKEAAIFNSSRDYLGVWKLLNSAIFITLLFFLVIAILLYLASDFIRDSYFGSDMATDTLLAMVPGILGLALSTLVAMALQGLKKTASSILILNILNNFLLGLFVVLLGLDDSISVAYTYSISSIFTFIFSIFLLYLTSGNINNKVDINKNLIVDGCLPLWIVMIMSLTIQWSAQFISAIWITTDEVAIIAVSQRVANLVSFVLMAVNMVIAPRFAVLYSEGKLYELRILVFKSIRIMIYASLPLLVLVLLLPGYILGVFGEEFVRGENILRIVVLGQFINVCTGSVGYLLSMSGHNKDLRNSTLITGSFSLIFSFILIPKYGVIGAAISISFSLIFQNLLAVYFVKLRLGINTLQFYLTK